jgi:WD40 repeat protein
VLASAGHDGTIKLWNIGTGESLGVSWWGPPVRALVFAPNKSMLAAAHG